MAVTIIVSLLNGLIGGIIGGIINRNTQYRTWLLQQRSQAFAAFLNDFAISQRTLRDVTNTNGYDFMNYDHRMQAFDAYKSTMIHSKIVRLYLPIDERATFTNKLETAFMLQSAPFDKVGRQLFDENVKEIEDILERHLFSSRWMGISYVERMMMLIKTIHSFIVNSIDRKK